MLLLNLYPSVKTMAGITQTRLQARPELLKSITQNPYISY